MKRFLLPILVLGFFLLMWGACDTSEDMGGPAGAKPGSKPAAKPSAQEPKAAAQQQGAGGASETVSRHSLIKEPTRPHPGWVCPSHPHMKSFYPEGCPIDKIPMMREGEYTCANHPQLSATAPGTCPIGNEALIKVKDLEKQTGKNIDELTQEALAKQKD